MSITTVQISTADANSLLSKAEGHFLDFKAKEISPSKLTRSISGFANAEGGELYVGIGETQAGFVWNGFADVEDANAFIQIFEVLFPLGDDFHYEFVASDRKPGVVLHISVQKAARVILAHDTFPYLRRNAQNLKIDTEEKRRRLELDKGIYSFENETLDVDLEFVTHSRVLERFLGAIIPHRSAEEFVKMELLSRRGIPKVSAVLLFSDSPQSALPDRCSVKIARYRTSGPGHRSALVGPAATIEGPLYDMIFEAVRQTKAQVEAHQVQGQGGLQAAKYPHETLHEIIANALIHRDYSRQDHVHIRVFDNRIEVQSPGRLAGHVTVANILDTRSIRNGQINRLINKFPNPPNKDMGEGLNTAVSAMRSVRLKDPTFVELEADFLVTIPHESLATAEELILAYLAENETITNQQARRIYPVETQHLMRAILLRMVRHGQIVRVEGTQRGGTRYKRPSAE